MIDVGSIDDFMEGLPRVVDVGGLEIGIVKWRGNFFAVRNRCPHMQARICQGGLVERKIVPGDTVGALIADDSVPVLSCPWHGWQFELETGCSIWDRNYRVTVFEIETRGDRLFVETTKPKRPPVAHSGDVANAEA